MSDWHPLVSVVIAVRNGARFIGQAIESVLGQTYDRVEIVVVDGASTDASVPIVSGYAHVRCIQQAGRTGFAGAWNEGIAIAGGELIAILDSDDLWDPPKLERQVEVLRRRPEVDYAITRVRFVCEPGVVASSRFDRKLLESWHVANMPSALLIRREAFDTVGPFRTDMTVANDIDWFARAKDVPLTGAIVPEVLLYKRVHDVNHSYNNTETLSRELLGLLRRSVDRQGVIR
jgi:glycosyltransferase involved in cell wall biosynthesis